MGWTWVNDLLAPEGKKKHHNWNARCPYYLCPGNKPVERPAKLKFMFKVSPMVYNYKCGYCGCGVNISVEVPVEQGMMRQFKENPALHGGKPSYRFHV